MVRLHQNAGDFQWALHLGHQLVAGRTLYDTPDEQYPLTAGILAIPFLHLKPEVAAGIFWGLSSGLLSFGLTKHGYHRLLVFLAYPYWAGLLAVQWSPIIAASAFFPLLLPVTMAKPQVGLPVFLSRLTRRGLIACCALGVLSLVLVPRWPLLWLEQAKHYDHFVPLFVLPGPLLLLAARWYRDRDAQLLLLSALLPQRWFFDTLPLWLIPKSRREILWTAAISWGAGILRWYHTPQSFTQVGRWTVLWIYLPMLAVLLLRKVSPEVQRETGGPTQTGSGARSERSEESRVGSGTSLPE